MKAQLKETATAVPMIELLCLEMQAHRCELAKRGRNTAVSVPAERSRPRHRGCARSINRSNRSADHARSGPALQKILGRHNEEGHATHSLCRLPNGRGQLSGSND